MMTLPALLVIQNLAFARLMMHLSFRLACALGANAASLVSVETLKLSDNELFLINLKDFIKRRVCLEDGASRNGECHSEVHCAVQWRSRDVL